VDIPALALVLVVGGGVEVHLRHHLTIAAFRRGPDSAALGVERVDDAGKEVPEKLGAGAAGAGQFRDLGHMLADLDAGLLEDLFLFERRHRETTG
jgi:hypothetical protein